MRRTSITVLGGLAVGSLLLTACGSGSASPPQAAPKVQLPLGSALPGTVKVGIIVTPQLGAEGHQDLGNAAGARVAQYRLNGTKEDVQLVLAADNGTASSGSDAVTSLLKAGVTGIVWASDGKHVLAGAKLAAAKGVPVLLPYQVSSQGLPKGAFITGPSEQQIRRVLSSFETNPATAKPMVFGDGSSTQLTAAFPGATVIKLKSLGNPTTVKAKVDRALQGKTVGEAVVLTNADTSALVVGELQKANVPNIVIGPAGVLAEFPQALGQSGSGATLHGNLYSVGLSTTDADISLSMQAFLQANRLMAAASSNAEVGRLTSIDLAATCFAQGGAATADTRSHDAVIALVAAAHAARSTRPSSVMDQLKRGFVVTRSDGLAGPTLTFGSTGSVPDDSVVILQSTGTPSSARQDAARICSATPSDSAAAPYVLPGLQWFAVPRSS